jgi:hypothetical protein
MTSKPEDLNAAAMARASLAGLRSGPTLYALLL